MNTRLRTNSRRMVLRERLNRTLKIALAVCLLGGVFCQITMLAKISAQSKKISSVNAQIRELSATAENMQVYLSMYRNLDRIEAQAYGLGMQFPEETQIRVVSLPGGLTTSSTQTAENTEVETLMETSMR